MRARLAFVGAAGAALGAVGARLLRRTSLDRSPDPRAEELRQRLDESRAVVSEREEFEAAETPVDQVDSPGGVDERRRELHERARSTADEMRRGD